MSRTARAVLAGALVVVAASCGGGSSNETPTVEGGKTFEGEGYSFTYPGSWVERIGSKAPPAAAGAPTSAPRRCGPPLYRYP